MKRMTNYATHLIRKGHTTRETKESMNIMHYEEKAKRLIILKHMEIQNQN